MQELFLNKTGSDKPTEFTKTLAEDLIPEKSAKPIFKSESPEIGKKTIPKAQSPERRPNPSKSPATQEPAAPEPGRRGAIKMSFDFDDDDILGKIEKPRGGGAGAKAGFLDDIFGKKSEKETKPSFLDDLMSGEKRRNSKPETDFILDSRYKKVGGEESKPVEPQPRRRRGNPELQSFPEDRKSESANPREGVEKVEESPFPWMAGPKKPEQQPQPPLQQQQQQPPPQQQQVQQQHPTFL